MKMDTCRRVRVDDSTGEIVSVKTNTVWQVQVADSAIVLRNWTPLFGRRWRAQLCFDLDIWMWRGPISVGLWIFSGAQIGLGLSNWALMVWIVIGPWALGVQRNWAQAQFLFLALTFSGFPKMPLLLFSIFLPVFFLTFFSSLSGLWPVQ